MRFNINKNTTYQGQPDQARQKMLFIIGAIVLIIISFMLYFAINSSSFQLTKVTPKNEGSVLSSSAEISFTFSKSLSKDAGESISFSIEPRLDFIFIHKDDTITLKFSDLPFMEQNSYLVTLRDVLSESGDRIETLSSALIINLDEKAKTLLGSLPLEENGYKISVLANNELLVEGDFENNVDEANKILAQAGVSDDSFLIKRINQDALELFE